MFPRAEHRDWVKICESHGVVWEIVVCLSLRSLIEQSRSLGFGWKRKASRALTVAGGWRDTMVHRCIRALSRGRVTLAPGLAVKGTGGEDPMRVLPETVSPFTGTASLIEKRGGS